MPAPEVVPETPAGRLQTAKIREILYDPHQTRNQLYHAADPAVGLVGPELITPVMAEFLPQIAANLQQLEQRIVAACERAQRPRDSVTLVAVTKYARLEWVQALWDLGLRHFGENRPQQLVARAAKLPESITWHLIGHLQSNKAKSVIPVAPWIHSIDSWKLLTLTNRLASDLGCRPHVLIEVNVSGEATKDGFAPADLMGGLPQLETLTHIDVAGLMTMAPASDDPEVARSTFRRLHTLREEIRQQLGDSQILPELSMGMTGDFEIAIAEGATLIRVGSALFEGLPEGE